MPSESEKIANLQAASLALLGALINAFGALWRINSQLPPSEHRSAANEEIDALIKEVGEAIEFLKRNE